MVRVVCVVGYPGAGKSVATEVAEELEIDTAVMGDQVRARAEDELDAMLSAEEPEEVVEAWVQLDASLRTELLGDNGSVNLSRSNLIGSWATVQRQRHGDDVVAEWTADYIEDGTDIETVLVDGIRSCEERDVFEERFDTVDVIHIDAPFELRLQRLRERDRDGEGDFTDDELVERDEREDEWGVGELVDDADFVVENTGTLDEYRSELRRILSA